MPKPKDTLLTVLLRFVPPEAREKVTLTFNLARALRAAQRDNAEPINEVGLFVDICEAAQGELLRVAKVVTESPRPSGGTA